MLKKVIRRKLGSEKEYKMKKCFPIEMTMKMLQLTFVFKGIAQNFRRKINRNGI